MPRDLIPFGAHTAPRRSGKADLGSRDCQPQGCASAGRRQRAVGAVLTTSGLLEGSCRDAIAALADLTADPYSVSEGAVFTDEPSGKLTLVYGVAHLYEPRVVHRALDGSSLLRTLMLVWSAW